MSDRFLSFPLLAAGDAEEVTALLARVWDFRLIDVGGKGITVGIVLLGLVGMAVAMVVSRFGAVWVSRAARRSFSLDESQGEILRKILFVLLATLLVFTILNWLSIPLTAFAFLGGALAIGLGFGAQTLMNNFISGLILLIERPIEVGDIIEVNGSTGKVTHLGSRCSRLRKFDGVEMLIPNSAFLEKEVTNWTLNDAHHRYDFTVGAAYGSSVDQVIAILEAAVREEPGVLSDPAPGVFLDAFGDSALVFRIYYWIEIDGTFDSRLVGSNIRRRIDADFRAAGIEMPFPQRDFRLRGAEPVTVRFEK